MNQCRRVPAPWLWYVADSPGEVRSPRVRHSTASVQCPNRTSPASVPGPIMHHRLRPRRDDGARETWESISARVELRLGSLKPLRVASGFWFSVACAHGASWPVGGLHERYHRHDSAMAPAGRWRVQGQLDLLVALVAHRESVYDCLRRLFHASSPQPKLTRSRPCEGKAMTHLARPVCSGSIPPPDSSSLFSFFVGHFPARPGVG
ncbi:hypothetical protein NUW54_g7439 [Trametes sanguinea]|uniref:Uncharacterized protein n=1 Tax=Trametes sanguinea TaxID=158606 RepID=A0ACC1PN39_9APHY|nr:hypothetical protein NUW54_g7439 [Trametes sanguinea]